jgi:ribosome-binding ATPase YchF (GTP1/OBG family)
MVGRIKLISKFLNNKYMSNVTEKKFLTEEEQATLKEIQSKSRALIGELGEIELVKLQLEKRHEIAKQFLIDLSTKEQEFTQLVSKKYGKSNLNPENGEITPLD